VVMPVRSHCCATRCPRRVIRARVLAFHLPPTFAGAWKDRGPALIVFWSLPTTSMRGRKCAGIASVGHAFQRDFHAIAPTNEQRQVSLQRFAPSLGGSLTISTIFGEETVVVTPAGWLLGSARRSFHSPNFRAGRGTAHSTHDCETVLRETKPQPSPSPRRFLSSARRNTRRPTATGWPPKRHGIGKRLAVEIQGPCRRARSASVGAEKFRPAAIGGIRRFQFVNGRRDAACWWSAEAPARRVHSCFRYEPSWCSAFRSAARLKLEQLFIEIAENRDGGPASASSRFSPESSGCVPEGILRAAAAVAGQPNARLRTSSSSSSSFFFGARAANHRPPARRE